MSTFNHDFCEVIIFSLNTKEKAALAKHESVKQLEFGNTIFFKRFDTPVGNLVTAVKETYLHGQLTLRFGLNLEGGGDIGEGHTCADFLDEAVDRLVIIILFEFEQDLNFTDITLGDKLAESVARLLKIF